MSAKTIVLAVILVLLGTTLSGLFAADSLESLVCNNPVVFLAAKVTGIS